MADLIHIQQLACGDCGGLLVPEFRKAGWVYRHPGGGCGRADKLFKVPLHGVASEEIADKAEG